jgi:hypothetical protein
MISKCELFPKFRLRASLRTWQINYCDADHSACARFVLVGAGQRPAPTLLPNGQHLPDPKPEEGE